MAEPVCAEAKPVGVFGGTFDPIHFGHLRLAEEALIEANLREVCFIPAGAPLLRDVPQVSAQQRLEMVQLALQNNRQFMLDSAEVYDQRPSYTFHTLERLRAKHGASQSIVLILGADAFLNLERWHRWEELFEYAHILVATRPGYNLHHSQMSANLALQFTKRQTAAENFAHTPAGNIASFIMTALDISATQIRQLFVSQKSARYLLPDNVIDYIEQHQLYRT